VARKILNKIITFSFWGVVVCVLTYDVVPAIAPWFLGTAATLAVVMISCHLYKVLVVEYRESSSQQECTERPVKNKEDAEVEDVQFRQPNALRNALVAFKGAAEAEPNVSQEFRDHANELVALLNESLAENKPRAPSLSEISQPRVRGHELPELSELLGSLIVAERFGEGTGHQFDLIAMMGASNQPRVSGVSGEHRFWGEGRVRHASADDVWNEALRMLQREKDDASIRVH